MNVFLQRIPVLLKGIPFERQENCRICNTKQAEEIGIVDYWDIKTSKLAKCSCCKHIQLDPMLNDSDTEKGCYAYYVEESLRTNAEEQEKNCVRNFRRGVLFGFSLKQRKIFPRSVLELGPGSGYFSAGLQFVFPDVEITVMDINSSLLSFNKQHHDYKTIEGIPDNFIEEYKNKFDLIIARDIIEHVSDISKVLSNINLYLKPDGYFHFITPNGHEDVWKHYLTYTLTQSHSELLINHVNYYDGTGLEDLLLQKGFLPVDYYTYKIKTTLKGRGWKMDSKIMSPVSKKLSADVMIKENADKITSNKYEKEDVLDKWYICPKAKWITYLFSLYQHSYFIKLNPKYNVGHEIYGLFKKESPS